MTKTIVANIPAKTIKIGRETRKIAARVETFSMDDDGCWTTTLGNHTYNLLQDEVIDVCQKATNWADLKREHFPMAGFHR